MNVNIEKDLIMEYKLY